MQDIHSIGGGGARLFSGGGGGVAADRRLRPQHHHHHHQGHQALKCPRCDSLNTKFCYYNNYNLSQPRHFCKSCRRYWTKGGVLRNVPVGGGCRKTKRSKPKQNTSSTITDSTASITTPQQQNRPPPENNQNKSSNSHSHSHSHSSSESSSLTATNNTAANTGVEAASAHSVSSVSNNLLNGMVESKLFAHGNMNPSFETALLEQGSDCGIFSEIGSFTSLITSTNDLSFGFNNIVNQQQQQGVEHGQTNYQNQQQWQTMQNQQQGMAGGLIDQTVQVELSGVQNNRGSNGGGFGALDWQGTGDQGGGLFDLPNAVDHAYWSQNQWNDQDHPSLYLP